MHRSSGIWHLDSAARPNSRARQPPDGSPNREITTRVPLPALGDHHPLSAPLFPDSGRSVARNLQTGGPWIQRRLWLLLGEGGPREAGVEASPRRLRPVRWECWQPGQAGRGRDRQEGPAHLEGRGTGPGVLGLWQVREDSGVREVMPKRAGRREATTAGRAKPLQEVGAPHGAAETPNTGGLGPEQWASEWGLGGHLPSASFLWEQVVNFSLPRSFRGPTQLSTSCRCFGGHPAEAQRGHIDTDLGGPAAPALGAPVRRCPVVTVTGTAVSVSQGLPGEETSVCEEHGGFLCS